MLSSMGEDHAAYRVSVEIVVHLEDRVAATAYLLGAGVSDGDDWLLPLRADEAEEVRLILGESIRAHLVADRDETGLAVRDVRIRQVVEDGLAG